MLDRRLAIELNGAGTKIRTRDLLITNQLLYQLSYTGTGYIRGCAFYALKVVSAMFLDTNFILRRFQHHHRFPDRSQ